MTQTPKTLTLREIFSPGGLISQQLEGYEFRQEQLDMANAVARAFAASEHLIVEAGTGVGKSFSYLIPAISLALKAEQTVVISTNTISLQEQLVTKDIPFLQRVLPRDFIAVLAKGRRNYLSRRRLGSLLAYQRGLFDTREEVEEVEEIVEWVNLTEDGSRADRPRQPLPQVWDKVASDRDNCLGRKCPTYDTCFYFKARREMYEANLLIVNHHLLFSDLAIRKDSEAAGILPDYDYLIIDEAHHLEATATHHMSLEFSNTRVKWLFDSLYNERNEGGLANRFGASQLMVQVAQAREQANILFGTIIDKVGEDNGNTLTKRIHQSNFVRNVLDAPLSEIEKTLKRLRDEAKTDDDEQEITAQHRYCQRTREELDLMIRQADPDYVYWAEISTWGRAPRIRLNATPANVSQMLQDNLFTAKNSVVMTSATLSTNNNFDYFKKRVGINECRELLVYSPFNFQQQVQIHIPPLRGPRSMPHPNSAEFTPAAIREIKHYLKLTQGKAFVLFTSYKMMDEVYDAVAPYLEEIGIDAFKQGAELSRTDMLQAFREDTNSVLFGTSSFWEGVDVRGEALSNVIITRLPFEVPTHPVMEARVKQIKERGGNEFFEFSLPEAILRLKQGFGRLIRTQTDKGIVVILDPRIKTGRYGKQFLASLPAGIRIFDAY